MMFGKIDKGQWWDRALTLVEGCTPVSEGCDNCWSAAMAHRFMPPDKESNEQSVIYNNNFTTNGKFNGKIVCREDRLALPLRVKKATAWAVWNDLFHEDVPFDFKLSAWVMMRDTPRHVYLILTKRPENMKNFFDLLYREQPAFSSIEPPFNIWVGVTAENQEQADKRIPILLKIPAAVRFVSVEPMLGPVDLSKNKGLSIYWEGLGGTIRTYYQNSNNHFLFFFTERERKGWVPFTGKGFDWVICGGESGPKARPMHPDWVRSLRDQCKAAGVPFFLKQMHVDGKLVKAPKLDGKQYLELPTTVRG